jgi:hypothetical protein
MSWKVQFSTLISDLVESMRPNTNLQIIGKRVDPNYLGSYVARRNWPIISSPGASRIANREKEQEQAINDNALLSPSYW